MTLNKALVRTPRPSRQIVVLCDGTNANLTGGASDTNVVKLAELLAHHPVDPARRIVFYDPGVGHSAMTPDAGVWNRLRQQWSRVEGLTQGLGVFENIMEAYLFVVRNWQPGDQLYFFGFSRGAFTARSAAGLVNLFGVVSREAETMISTLLHLYFAPRDEQTLAAIQQVVRLFSPVEQRAVPIHFVGVWDTVESVGVPPFRMRIAVRPVLANKRFLNVRQALALDEIRKQFQPRLYAQAEGSFPVGVPGTTGTVQQRWFSGVHTDIGGGAASAPSVRPDAPLHWLTAQAIECGLEVPSVAAREDVVAAAFAAMSAAGVGEGGGRELASERVRSPFSHLWALGGLEQRETSVRLDDGSWAALPEHPSVQRLDDAAGDPPSRVEMTRGTWIALVVAFVLALLAVTAAGHALRTGQGNPAISSFIDAPASWRANGRFQHWQLLGLPSVAGEQETAATEPRAWFDAWRDEALSQWRAAPKAVGWDLVFIAAYAYLLSIACHAAFARLAGRRRAVALRSRLLLPLGYALPVLVVADLLENLITVVVVWMINAGWDVVAMGLAGLMAWASIAKWAGFAGVAMLLAMGAWASWARHGVHRAAVA